MRHHRAGKKLNRNRKQREALFKGLVASLIEHGAIKTTEAKAKAVKSIMDKLMTTAKKNTPQARRLLSGFLHHRQVTNRLVDEVMPQAKSRTSGFTKTIRLGRRPSDNTMMMRLELIGNPPKDQKPKALPAASNSKETKPTDEKEKIAKNTK